MFNFYVHNLTFSSHQSLFYNHKRTTILNFLNFLKIKQKYCVYTFHFVNLTKHFFGESIIKYFDQYFLYIIK